MTKLEAMRNLVLNDLGWLGKYEYRDLGCTDQIYINEKVEEMELAEKARQLTLESLAVLGIAIKL